MYARTRVRARLNVGFPHITYTAEVSPRVRPSITFVAYGMFSGNGVGWKTQSTPSVMPSFLQRHAMQTGKLILALAAIYYLAGCASGSRYYLNGQTQAQFDAASNACRNSAVMGISGETANQSGYMLGQAASGAPGAAAAGLGGLALLFGESVANDARYEQCITSRGFTKADPATVAAREGPQQTNVNFQRGVAAYNNKDYSQALAIFKPLAEANDSRAQAFLGHMIQMGFGTSIDLPLAAVWHRKAAEQGNAFAQVSLGFMFFSGMGVVKNQPESLTWYQRAADQGNADGQFSVGTFYASGTVVSKDDTVAVYWYRKAAMQGHPGAREELRKRGVGS